MALPRAARWALRIAAWLLSIALAIALGFSLYAVALLPPLMPWHKQLLKEEFDAQRDARLDFAGYLQLETRLFDEQRGELERWARDGPDPRCKPAPGCAVRARQALAYSRFNLEGGLQRLADGAPFNRSYTLTQDRPQGHALLVHGLTDSPYSMLALARTLHARGLEVTVLRLPGHGTLPSMMKTMSADDWTAAMRLAAAAVAARAPAGQPFYVGGYSTGATLALQYALDTLQDASLRRPDRVLLLSPAIELTSLALLSELIDVFAVVPLAVFDKVHWQEIAPEFDPYKFNSFPVNATRQVNRSTRALQRALADAEANDRLAKLPPVVAWQSAVDATVGSDGVVDRLFARLHDPAHRLVLFDMNRASVLRSVASRAPRELIQRVIDMPRGFMLDIVSNGDRPDAKVAVHRLTPDGMRSVRETGLDWPSDLVSLSHVALPFPADDPVYGFVPGSGRGGVASIGSWLLRGENGAITLSLGSLTRLRSNPFWLLIEEDVAGLVAQDLAARRP